MENINESTVNAEPVENVEPQQDLVIESAESVQKVEVAEQPKVEEKPVQSKEENAKFAEIRRRAEQEAIDKFIANQGYVFDGKPIKTKAEYDEAMRINQERERRAALEEKGIDPTIVDEYVNNNPTVKEAREALNKQKQEQFSQKNKVEFLEYFRNNNNRDFDPGKDSIPNEVWELSEAYEKSNGKEGKSLVDAYMRHENSILRKKLQDIEKGTKTQEINSVNAATSTGSVTGNGKPVTKEITAESIATMSEKEISQNWSQVKKILNMR
jgi:hypothetical protein